MTKYQFLQLFSKAWYKAIQPNNLISGFAKTGIHPFNSNAISVPTLPDMEVDSEHEEEVAASEDGRGDLEEMMEEGAPEDNQGVKATAFSPSELELFTTRYENGYDIYTDTEYVIWLAENHPDALPDDVLNTLQPRSDPYRPFEEDSPLVIEPNESESNVPREKSFHEIVGNVSLDPPSSRVSRDNMNPVDSSSEPTATQQNNPTITHQTAVDLVLKQVENDNRVSNIAQFIINTTIFKTETKQQTTCSYQCHGNYNDGRKTEEEKRRGRSQGAAQERMRGKETAERGRKVKKI